jgi:hypothetical protein
MRSMHLFVLAALVAGSSVQANELDREVGINAPSAIIVRELSNGTREIFKADGLMKKVENTTQAQAAVDLFVKEENQVSSVSSKDELDRTSADEAWYYWYNPYFNRSYVYGWYYGYNYYYRPTFYWNTGYYNYYFYYWW